jgi:hypothetical protein
MKTRYMSEFQSPVRLAHLSVRVALAFWAGVLHPAAAVATSVGAASDTSFETMLREQKRDFERYITGREKNSDKAATAAEALRKSRMASIEKHQELEKQYRRTMKRYSMEESEKLEQQYEERKEKESLKDDRDRLAFAKQRDERRKLEAEINPVDSYREFEINMAVPPESKASHTEIKSSAP